MVAAFGNRAAVLLRTAIWGVALAVSAHAYGPGFVSALGSHDRISDFFQEWASARNYREGLPIYTPHAITAWRYLRYRPTDANHVFVRINGHPPQSVLLGLPFASLDYPQAFLLWNLLSLAALAVAAAVVLRCELRRVRGWHVAAMLTCLLSNSLAEHLRLGQLSILVVLLLTGVLWADDRGYRTTAGVLLGTAAALKFFPAALFFYFVIRRDWRAVGAGLATIAFWTVLSALLFGVRTYVDFAHYAVPEVLGYRNWWTNYSIAGLWFKLFDGSGGQSTPIWQSRWTAQIGSTICVAGMMLLSAYATYRGRAVRESRRSSLAMWIVAAMLAAPVAWDHYFLLLLWPATRTAARLPSRDPLRALLYGAIAVLWVNPIVWHVYATEPLQPATPLQILGFISLPFYALTAVYAACVRQTLREAVGEPGPATTAGAVGDEAVTTDATTRPWQTAVT